MADEQRIAVVTGGAGVIGSAIVAGLKASGHRTVVLDRAGGDVVCDLSSESSTREAAATVLERHGRCDVLVNCAGYLDSMTLEELDLSRWRALMAVNVEAGLLLAQAFVPGMVENGFGRIVFISSDGQWVPPTADFLPYVTSKAALLGAMRSLAATYGGDGIAVSAVAPGLTDSPAARAVIQEGALDAVIATQAVKRRLVPEDTANTVAFLASDAAEALTGQVLVVDGGTVMR
ncbi:SDR family NAD(P)-dependent oxidoreductase [Aeromicrobium endophyticum]|uniref:SDR family NAD(P)-dependent oxidoreductase n=1 Tax=Aeromicrobium endophyticum TaxID=2292704 RepID=A0A371PCN3_9ACTN|nr:SDR family oxidoreductase [Aeromicrobium endophyticum]REK73699.1 SDR family NAD(P)-dependent oxidoreductase [Aeromicrobium endophyticum]